MGFVSGRIYLFVYANIGTLYMKKRASFHFVNAHENRLIMNETYSEDYPDLETPLCIEWTSEDVATWISDLGFPYYKECFEKNFLTGRKLVLLRASHLPKMGITNFEDIKILTSSIRKLLNTKLIVHSRSISLLPREPWALYLEELSKTSLTPKPKYADFLKARGIKHMDQ